MSNKNTETVQVVKNQNNLKELFIEWNTENKSNIKCAKYHCSNDVDANAYIVYKNVYSQNKYIVPLCTECYEQENNMKNCSTENFTDMGARIIVDKSLLLKYTR